MSDGADAPEGRATNAAALLVAAFGFFAGVFPIFDADVFWHLASGRWILEHGAVPRIDPFRFTAEGVRWVDHEWLFQVVARGVELAGGLPALFWARAAALGLLGVAIFHAAKRAPVPDGAAALLAIAAVLGVRPRFLIRPEIVTLFALLLLLGWLDRRRGSRQTATAAGTSVVRRLGAVVALVVLWVNFHGEALLAPGIAFLYLLGDALEIGGLAEARRRWRSVLGIPALLGLALLANPNGWRLIEVPLGIRGALADLPAVNPEWLPAWRAPQPFFFGALAVVGALALVARSRSGRLPAPAWALPTMALAVVALSAVRHQALFFAVAAPYAARCLAIFDEVRSISAAGARRLRAVAGLAAVVASLWCAFPPGSGPLRPWHGGLATGTGLDPATFPVAVVDRVARVPGLGPLYNELLHGGYLLWRTCPPRKVFVDGRMELDPALLHEVGAARRDAAAWNALLDRHGIVGALVPYDERRVPVFERGADGRLVPAGDAPIHSLLFPRAPEGEWELVDWDDAALLFLRRAERERVWPGEPYRLLEPEDPAAMRRRAAADPAFRERALAELDRARRESPASDRAVGLERLLRSVP